MTKTLILHIGSPKCGSTYLQRVLLQNSVPLEKAGVVYPRPNGKHPGNAVGLADLTNDGLNRWFNTADTVVLSHEDLFSQAPRGQALSALAQSNGISVQVVAFMRPFSEFIFGDYSQFMKQHFERFLTRRCAYEGRGFEEFAIDRSRSLSPVGYFKSWQSLFKETPIILASHRSIRQVMTPFLNGADMDWNVPRDHTNPSLRMEDCDRLAAAIADKSIPKSKLREMFQTAFKNTGAPDLGKTEERRRWIEALFVQQNSRIFQEFGFDNRLTEAKP